MAASSAVLDHSRTSFGAKRSWGAGHVVGAVVGGGCGARKVNAPGPSPFSRITATTYSPAAGEGVQGTDLRDARRTHTHTGSTSAFLSAEPWVLARPCAFPPLPEVNRGMLSGISQNQCIRKPTHRTTGLSAAKTPASRRCDAWAATPSTNVRGRRRDNPYDARFRSPSSALRMTEHSNSTTPPTHFPISRHAAPHSDITPEPPAAAPAPSSAPRVTFALPARPVERRDRSPRQHRRRSRCGARGPRSGCTGDPCTRELD